MNEPRGDTLCHRKYKRADLLPRMKEMFLDSTSWYSVARIRGGQRDTAIWPREFIAAQIMTPSDLVVVLTV